MNFSSKMKRFLAVTAGFLRPDLRVLNDMRVLDFVAVHHAIHHGLSVGFWHLNNDWGTYEGLGDYAVEVLKLNACFV